MVAHELPPLDHSGHALTQAPRHLGTGRAYDMRPTPVDLEPSPDAAGRVNAWRLGPDGRVIGLTDDPCGVPALYACNVTGLRLGRIEVDRPDPLPEGWATLPVTINCAGN